MYTTTLNPGPSLFQDRQTAALAKAETIHLEGDTTPHGRQKRDLAIIKEADIIIGAAGTSGPAARTDQILAWAIQTGKKTLALTGSTNIPEWVGFIRA